MPVSGDDARKSTMVNQSKLLRCYVFFYIFITCVASLMLCVVGTTSIYCQIGIRGIWRDCYGESLRVAVICMYSYFFA